MAGFVFVFFVFVVFIIVMASKAGRSVQAGVAAIDYLETNGVRAYGLVLACQQWSTGVRIGTRRFEQRAMTIDVEIPGRAPYVAQGTFLVPRGLVEVIPGAALDLAVDPRNPNQLAILGPGGFSGPWIRIGPPNPY
jgi:hypothetical protein